MPIFFLVWWKGKAITLKNESISDLTDFSYDFQDLDFIRIQKNNPKTSPKKGNIR
jgi:hypothetical protein